MSDHASSFARLARQEPRQAAGLLLQSLTPGQARDLAAALDAASLEAEGWTIYGSEARYQPFRTSEGRRPAQVAYDGLVMQRTVSARRRADLDEQASPTSTRQAATG